jgi:hypothetical protein
MSNDDRSQKSTRPARRPQYFDDPAVDHLHSAFLALAAELSVAYDRIDALERLLESKGVLQRAEVEQFAPDERAESERAVRREAFLRRILQTFTDQRDELLGGAKRGPAGGP